MSKSKSDKDPKKTAPAERNGHHDGGWRETIESIAMAVILALLFRGFVAEAFVIPTGSMAPTLQGRHKDVWCPKCNHEYQVSCSAEQDSNTGLPTGGHVFFGTCPICRYTQQLDPLDKPNDGSFSGDRIIVAKFAYDLAEPQRWDVIVFKYPGSAVQNYIKRLIGLPGELVRIIGGNIQTCPVDHPDPDTALRVARKPPHKLNAMLQIVDDTNHIPQALIDVGWPSRWQAWPANDTAWQSQNGGREFVAKGDQPGESWLRYRHLVPTGDDWAEIEAQHKLPAGVADRPGQLITDFYAYNTSPNERGELTFSQVEPFWQSWLTKSYSPPIDRPQVAYRLPAYSEGLHWVDDLAVECLADVTGNTGELSLLLMRGGVKHLCRINLADGKATLSMVDGSGKALKFADDDGKQETTSPVAQTTVRGKGSYRLRLSNCDHEMLLWVNGSVVKFDGPTTYLADDFAVPAHSATEPGELAPAGVGTKGAAVKLQDLRIYRDKYYIATMGTGADYDRQISAERIQEVFRDPSLWEGSGLFAIGNRRHVQFALQENQFLPLGDNSPASSDGRFWSQGHMGQFLDGDHHYVERDLLIGKALVIYWPHTWNRPIPFTPNFRKMGPIR